MLNPVRPSSCVTPTTQFILLHLLLGLFIFQNLANRKSLGEFGREASLFVVEVYTKKIIYSLGEKMFWEVSLTRTSNWGGFCEVVLTWRLPPKYLVQTSPIGLPQNETVRRFCLPGVRLSMFCISLSLNATSVSAETRS